MSPIRSSGRPTPRWRKHSPAPSSLAAQRVELAVALEMLGAFVEQVSVDLGASPTSRLIGRSRITPIGPRRSRGCSAQQRQSRRGCRVHGSGTRSATPTRALGVGVIAVSDEVLW